MTEKPQSNLNDHLVGHPVYDLMYLIRTFNQTFHNNSFQPDYHVKEGRLLVWKVLLNHGGFVPNQGPDEYPPTVASRSSKKFWQARGSQTLIRRDMFKAQRANLTRAMTSILSQLIARYLAEGQPIHYRGRRILSVMTQTLHVDPNGYRNPELIGYYSDFAYGQLIRHNRHQVVKLLISGAEGADVDTVASKGLPDLPAEPFLLVVDLCAIIYDRMIYDEETHLPMVIQHLPITYMASSVEEEDHEIDQDMISMESETDSDISGGSCSDDEGDGIEESCINTEKMNQELAEKTKSETLDLLKQELAEFEELEDKYQPKDQIDPDRYPYLDGFGDEYLGLKILQKNKNVVVEVHPSKAELILSPWTAAMLDEYGQEDAEEAMAEQEDRIEKRAARGLKPRPEDQTDAGKGPCYKLTYESIYKEVNQTVRKRWKSVKNSLRKKLKKKM